jgi:hypothetical protein
MMGRSPSCWTRKRRFDLAIEKPLAALAEALPLDSPFAFAQGSLGVTTVINAAHMAYRVAAYAATSFQTCNFCQR